MKRISLFLFTWICLFSSFAYTQDDLVVPVIEVHDGDTIKTRLTLPSPLDEVSVRIFGIDTPEMPADSYYETGKLSRAKCVKEAELALEATQYLRTLIWQHGGMLSLKAYQYDKYGGRILADAYVIDLETGIEVNIADKMLERGYAVEYFGGTKTKDWCE